MPSTGDIVRASDFEAIKPQLSIGTVSTGAAGSNASASITGTSPNFKLNLTIPRGNTGATGATGPQGPSGTYTGPLKPTSSYWRSAVGTVNSSDIRTGRINIPAGGTWAWTSSGAGYRKGVSAGGSLLENIRPSSDGGALDIGTAQLLADMYLCWRIQ